MPNPSNENCWLQKQRFSKGALIVNSKLNGQNIGYPGQPDAIDWFVQMMKKAAPKMSQDDLKTIETALRSFKRT
jgi:hypothetical protein